MSRISEKVAYLDGLMEGLNIKEDKYAKVFTAIVDALDLIAEEMADHEDTLADLDDSVEEIFENLDEYDDLLYGDEDEDEEEEDDFDDDDFFEIVCPNCGEPKLPHHACMSCGKYKDTQAIEVKEVK